MAVCALIAKNVVTLHTDMINRNTKKELNTDIDFIDGIIKHIDEGDLVSAKKCLSDWKDELENIKKKT